MARWPDSERECGGSERTSKNLAAARKRQLKDGVHKCEWVVIVCIGDRRLPENGKTGHFGDY